MNYLPIVIFVLVIVALIAFSARARRRQAAQAADLQERIGVGTEVMTTSGLHGTVVALNGDGSVKLSIAAGVEVTWEVAALRDRASLPPQYRRDGDDMGDDMPGSGESQLDAVDGPADRVRLDKQRHSDDA